jgi:hypothetical protein
VEADPGSVENKRELEEALKRMAADRKDAPQKVLDRKVD